MTIVNFLGLAVCCLVCVLGVVVELDRSDLPAESPDTPPVPVLGFVAGGSGSCAVLSGLFAARKTSIAISTIAARAIRTMLDSRR